MDLLRVFASILLVVSALRLDEAVREAALIQLSLLDRIGQLVLGPFLSVDGDLGLLLQERDHPAFFL